jgi:ADP-heptose:LPS heptosyltransferase
MTLEPRSVAVFRALQLGDMLCAVPALRALRRAWPDARLTLIGLPWARDFARRFSHFIDDFLVFPGFPGMPEQEPNVRAWPDFLREAQAREFDLAIQLHGDGRHTNALLRLLGARNEAGFTPGPTEGLFLGYPSTGHESRRLLALAAHLGADASDESMEFPLQREDDAAWAGHPSIKSLTPGGYVCVHAGARAADKRWPPSHFAAVADALAQESRLPVVLTGSEQESALVGEVAHAMRSPAIDAAAAVPVGALAALIARSRLLVSNDTGASHLAAALRVPSVVVFRSTEIERWAPLDRELHRPVWDPAAQRVDEVISEALRLLAAHPLR